MRTSPPGAPPAFAAFAAGFYVRRPKASMRGPPTIRRPGAAPALVGFAPGGCEGRARVDPMGCGSLPTWRVRAWTWIATGIFAAQLAPPSRADVPFPTCAQAACSDPTDFAGYVNTATVGVPNDYDPNSGEAWKYAPDSGMDIPGVWQATTGRPDVVDAVLDSGIEWDRADLARMLWLNAAELPVPPGCASKDCNSDGFVSVDDFAASCTDSNGTGFCDGQDLIRQHSDGVDDDGNGYLDDIAGWDFLDDDNDPSDDVRYGHGTGEAGDQVSEANNGSGFPA